MSHRLSLKNIERAAQTIDPVFLNSPQYICEPLSDALGAEVTLKVETLNPIRCFKGRGADFFVASLGAEEKIVCASAGNFGQAMAYCCRKRGIALTVFAAVSANPLKIERIKAMGATVVLEGADFDEAIVAAQRFAQTSGGRFVLDGREPLISEGAGTMGCELLSLPQPPDILLIPLGGGAMLSGIARIIKERRPETQIIAVQAAGASAMTDSWRAGRVIIHKTMNTIADGIGVRVPIPEALDDIRGLIDDALLVREGSLMDAMRLLHRHAGIVAEPSGAAGIAALLENADRFRHQRVGTIICGGNLTVEQIRDWLLTK